MNKRIILIASMILALGIPAGFAQSFSKISKKDLQLFTGNWKGSLTYLDYSSGKPYTMPADITIKQVKHSNTFIFYNIYPDEPKANSYDTLVVSADGKMINNEPVVSKRMLDDGRTEIVTERPGIDGNDNKPALIRITYTVGKKTFTNIKEVQFTGQNEWIKRHEYSYTRK